MLLKSNTSLTALDLSCNRLCFISFSLNTDNGISTEGVIKLSEALKSNSSLTSLNLKCNTLVASFHTHSIQVMLLVMKEVLNYLKRSNQIHHLRFSGSLEKLIVTSGNKLRSISTETQRCGTEFMTQ
jgi:hypothetical protein